MLHLCRSVLLLTASKLLLDLGLSNNLLLQSVLDRHINLAGAFWCLENLLLLSLLGAPRCVFLVFLKLGCCRVRPLLHVATACTFVRIVLDAGSDCFAN